MTKDYSRIKNEESLREKTEAMKDKVERILSAILLGAEKHAQHGGKIWQKY